MKMKTRYKKHSLKIISVLLSIFIWVYVLNSEKVKFEKTVNLEYILPDDMLFAEKPVQEVTFLIRGPRAFVRTVAEREDRLVIDLNRNSKKALKFQVDINPAQLNLPFGMVVEKVLPRKISIRLEKRASKIVPIKLNFVGSLPEQLTLEKIEVKPSEVEVYGPRSVLANLKELISKPVPLAGLVGQEMVNVELNLPDERMALVTGNEFSLYYQLKASSSNFTVKNHPIKFLTHSRDAKFSATSATLKILVPEKILKNRSNVSSNIQVWADIPYDAKGRVEVPLKVVLPPGIHLLEISPKSIIVNIQ